LLPQSGHFFLPGRLIGCAPAEAFLLKILLALQYILTPTLGVAENGLCLNISFLKAPVVARGLLVFYHCIFDAMIK